MEHICTNFVLNLSPGVHMSFYVYKTDACIAFVVRG